MEVGEARERARARSLGRAGACVPALASPQRAEGPTWGGLGATELPPMVSARDPDSRGTSSYEPGTPTSPRVHLETSLAPCLSRRDARRPGGCSLSPGSQGNSTEKELTPGKVGTQPLPAGPEPRVDAPTFPAPSQRSPALPPTHSPPG
uniref:Uncharacterized protein n=1 Tax=Molossus molossus TaxID=27622 RepID=A0A7J8BKJ6_MOLMO|nr:hypothetical protein HJG59_010209 [Molossus molossus]